MSSAYDELIDRLPDGLVIVQEGRVVFANATAARTLGFPDAAALVGRARQELVHAGSQEALAAREAALAGAQLPGTGLVRLVRADGRLIEVEIRSAPTTWEGRPAMQNVGRDVTARERERRLREAYDALADRLLAGESLAACWQAVAEAAVAGLGLVGMGTWFRGRDGGMRLVAAAGSPEVTRRATTPWSEAVWGGSLSHQALRTGQPALVDPTPTAPAAWGEALLAAGIRGVIAMPVHVHGRVLGVSTWYLPWPIVAAPDRHLVALAETAARRLAVAHLVAERQLVLQLLESAMVGTTTPVMITDFRGTIVWANASLCWLTGYAREELLGAEPGQLFEGVRPQPGLAAFAAELAAGQAAEAPFQLYRKDGRAIHVLVSSSPMAEAAGEEGHVVTMFTELPA